MTISLGLAAMANAAMVHRYSFDTDASDSIGGADGTLVNGASVSGGQALFDGSNDYVNLDASTIAIDTFTTLTIESWWTHDDLTRWQRVFDFGDNTSDYLFYSPVGEPGGSSNPNQVIGLKNNPTEQALEETGKLAAGSYHMAMTFDDATNTIKYYVNGAFVSEKTDVTNTLASIGTTNAYLGKAQWSDPYLDGSIDEFRIYDTVLTAAEVTSSYDAGPNAVPEPSSSALLGLAGLALILRRRK